MKKGKSRMVCLKLSEKERLIIKRNADMFTEGNLSAWLRRAGKEYTPSNVNVVIHRKASKGDDSGDFF